MFDTIDSTNLEAIRLIKAGIFSELIIWAQSQTNGKGSKGRVWQSELGNLYISIIKTPQVELNFLPQLSFVAALAVYEAINFVVNSSKITIAQKNCFKTSRSLNTSLIKIELKWPNDILINEKKVAGILTESIVIDNNKIAVIGIGVNVEHSPKNLSYAATSLNEENFNLKNLDYLLNLIMKNFDKQYNLWLDKKFIGLRQAWLDKAYKLGKVVSINDGRNQISGLFEKLDSNGAIILKTASGQYITFNNGDLLN